MSINPKVRRALSRMVNPTKSKTATVAHKGGGMHKYSYETLSDVVEIITNALDSEGVAMHQHVTILDGKPYMALELFDDEESIVYDMRPWKEMPDIQAQGSWETYTRRYQLKTAFNLVGEDDDGQAAMPRPKPIQTPNPNPESQVEPQKRDNSELNQLTKQLAEKMGLKVSDAARYIVEKYGNPKDMGDTAYKALIFAVRSEANG